MRLSRKNSSEENGNEQKESSPVTLILTGVGIIAGAVISLYAFGIKGLEEIVGLGGIILLTLSGILSLYLWYSEKKVSKARENLLREKEEEIDLFTDTLMEKNAKILETQKEMETINENLSKIKNLLNEKEKEIEAFNTTHDEDQFSNMILRQSEDARNAIDEMIEKYSRTMIHQYSSLKNEADKEIAKEKGKLDKNKEELIENLMGPLNFYYRRSHDPEFTKNVDEDVIKEMDKIQKTIALAIEDIVDEDGEYIIPKIGDGFNKDLMVFAASQPKTKEGSGFDSLLVKEVVRIGYKVGSIVQPAEVIVEDKSVFEKSPSVETEPVKGKEETISPSDELKNETTEELNKKEIIEGNTELKANNEAIDEKEILEDNEEKIDVK